MKTQEIGLINVETQCRTIGEPHHIHTVMKWKVSKRCTPKLRNRNIEREKSDEIRERGSGFEEGNCRGENGNLQKIVGREREIA